jgi:hypothetical protein
MAASNPTGTPVFAFDDSLIQWQLFPGLEHLEFCLYDVDEERQVIDLIVKFEPGEVVAMHNHVAQTNMFVIQGELRMYETDGSLKEIRPAGKYCRGRRDDCHSEGGGPDGAIVFYSIRGHGSDELLEIVDGNMSVLAKIGMDDIRAVWAAQQAAT